MEECFFKWTAREVTSALRRLSRNSFLNLLVLVCALVSAPQNLFSAETSFQIAAAQDEIIFRWNHSIKGVVTIREFPLSEGPAGEGAVVWTGLGANNEARVSRFHAGTDRIFSKYQIASDSSPSPTNEPQFVTDFSALPRRAGPPERSLSKKGIACLLDPADGVDLGFAQANQNIDIAALLDLQNPSPKTSFEYQGRRIGLQPGAVQHLDKAMREAFHSGMRVTGILLNNVSKGTPQNSPLVHPFTKPLLVPIGPSAFNTATAEGVFYYRAILSWLLERYTREDAQFGQLAGLVIGNEIQSHWSWYHLGLVEPAVVLKEYSAALRIADLITRSTHSDFPIYISLDHHWRAPASEEPGKGFSAVEALEGINEVVKSGGDFPWGVAFHPYPENLLDPQFWKDRAAPFRFDAPKLTFHNLEVLPAFLKQPRFLTQGHVRRIALTEQGFHCPKGGRGEELQAAAYALAWKKIQALPEIESFLYHRHVDHPHEYGLSCGIREHDGSSNVFGVGRKRKIWEVVRGAGTSEEDAVFAFALPIVGRTDWKNVVRSEFDPPRDLKPTAAKVIYDFALHLKKARAENVQAIEKQKIGPPDEVQETGILEHPKARGRGLLSFTVEIPAHGPNDKEYPVLKFDALLNNKNSFGAGFYVSISGCDVFSRVLRGAERVPQLIDLRRWQGQIVEVVFAVDADGDPAHDWAVWVSPTLQFQAL